MNPRSALVFIFILLGTGTEILSQTIPSNTFNKVYLRDNFSDNTLKWPILNNRDNFFIVQQGELILERKNKESEYAIFNAYADEPSFYSLTAEIKLSSTTDAGYAGIMFMVQTSGQGGFIVEVNNDKQYRIKQLENGRYKFLTGTVKKEGWVKSKELNADTFNNIKVLAKANKADIYINNTFIASVEEASYNSGKYGIMIGPQSKAEIKKWEVRIKS